MFGIYSQTSMEFVMCEIAAILYGFTTVPVYDTLGEEAMVYIFNQTQMETLFLSHKHAEKICKLKKEKNELNFLKNLIIMDQLETDQNLLENYSALFNIITLD